jgi:hypothetical protein
MTMRLFKKKPPFSKLLAINPPAPRAERRGVAIVTMLKDEEPYIEEWLAFHKAAGIRHFIIYDNGSTDNTVSVIKKSLPADEVTIFPWAGRFTDVEAGQYNSQVVAYAHAILNFGAAFRWVAFMDIDEFIFPVQAATIEEALQAVNGFPNVSLPWHMFGRSGHQSKPAGGVLKNYLLRAAEPISNKKNATNFKCIVDPCEVTEVSVHHFETRGHGDATCNDSGQVFSRKDRKTSEFYSARHLRINHYYTRSTEEFARKLAKGPADPGTRERFEKRLNTALESIESDVVEDQTIIKFAARIGFPLA